MSAVYTDGWRRRHRAGGFPRDSLVLAAFDFDGTLTRRDTLIPFLRFLCGTRAVGRCMLSRSAPLSVALALDRAAERSRLKSAVLRDLLAGREYDDVSDAGQRFARHLVEGPQLRPDTVARLRWHREQGHEVVIVSASLEAYIHPFAHLVGGASVLATRLSVDGDGRLTGSLIGANCRGAEKVRRLRECGLTSNTRLWAYGDSTGDRELLAAAQVPQRVGGRVRLRTPPQWTAGSSGGGGPEDDLTHGQEVDGR